MFWQFDRLANPYAQIKVYHLTPSIAGCQNKQLCTPAELNFRLCLPCFAIICRLCCGAVKGGELFLSVFLFIIYFFFFFFLHSRLLKDKSGADWRANRRNTVISCRHGQNQDPSVVFRLPRLQQIGKQSPHFDFDALNFPQPELISLTLSFHLFQPYFHLHSGFQFKKKRPWYFYTIPSIVSILEVCLFGPSAVFQVLLAEEQKSRPAPPPCDAPPTFGGPVL